MIQYVINTAVGGEEGKGTNSGTCPHIFRPGPSIDSKISKKLVQLRTVPPRRFSPKKAIFLSLVLNWVGLPWRFQITLWQLSVVSAPLMMICVFLALVEEVRSVVELV
jgi:hypothetical protein